jgi:hypothetical protein
VAKRASAGEGDLGEIVMAERSDHLEKQCCLDAMDNKGIKESFSLDY